MSFRNRRTRTITKNFLRRAGAMVRREEETTRNEEKRPWLESPTPSSRNTLSYALRLFEGIGAFSTAESSELESE